MIFGCLVSFYAMFIRQKKNKSGSISVQIIRKNKGINHVFKTVGCTEDEKQLRILTEQARYEQALLEQQEALFVSDDDARIEGYLKQLRNTQIRVIGPELMFGKIYDAIGYSAINETLFRHLVICRLAYPGSKLKTIDYLYRYQGVHLEIDTIYRFLDTIYNRYKRQIEEITFQHTKKLLRGEPGIVFYDLTTLYFEASDEDDFRKMGYSKDGKHQNPQILLGLLVGTNGYPIAYKMFEGNLWEGDAFIPALQEFEKRFALSKPMVISDAGLLSNKNISTLEGAGYTYILGARIKNENREITNRILQLTLKDGAYAEIRKDNDRRLIVHYSAKRAIKDEHTRLRGVKRLEKNLQSGKLTKSHINNRGYNKYLKLQGEVTIEIDYAKFHADKQWDGLKGYVTNSTQSASDIIENYKHLWQIEKAFRISKTDLRVRPIYHRLRRRIEAHLTIAFAAYAVYKELERILAEAKAPFSVIRAAQLTHTMYQIDVVLPESKQQKQVLLQMDEEQTVLYKIIKKYP